MNFKRSFSQISIIFLMSILAALSIQWFITPAQTVPTEVMGISMGVASSIFTFESTSYFIFFWSIYFCFMVPFFIYGYLKVGKRFTFLTLAFVFGTTISGLIISAIPLLNNLKMFGTSTSWYMRLLYASLGSFFYGLALGVTLSLGGSSGGTDFLAAKWSQNPKIRISYLLAFFAIVTLIFASFLFEIFGIQIKYQNLMWSQIAWKELFLTFGLSLWQCILGPIVIYFVYTKEKEVTITVTTKNSNLIYQKLKSENKNILIIEHNNRNIIFRTLVSKKEYFKRQILNIDHLAELSMKTDRKRLLKNAHLWK